MAVVPPHDLNGTAIARIRTPAGNEYALGGDGRWSGADAAITSLLNAFYTPSKFPALRDADRCRAVVESAAVFLRGTWNGELTPWAE